MNQAIGAGRKDDQSPSSSFDVVVLGESLMDVVLRAASASEFPGGSPANVALALGRLGRAVALLTGLGSDDRGELLRRWLVNAGVDVRPVERSHKTSIARATIDANGDADYEFDISWDLPDSLDTPKSRVIHTGSLGAWMEPGAGVVASAIRAARDRSVISFDPNVRDVDQRDRGLMLARIEALISTADIVKASDEDLDVVAPGESHARVAYRWLAGGASLVVITGGSRGAVGYASTASCAVAAARVQVVDTVGAGDTFMAVLIDWVAGLGSDANGIRSSLRRLSEQDLATALARASRAAAITVGRPGMDPPNRGELDACRDPQLMHASGDEEPPHIG